MRQTVLITAVMAVSTTAAAQKYGMGGCGLGSKLFETNSKGSQILAATTNSSTANQTFGITSGTSNCTAEGVVTSQKEQEVYAEVNLLSLSQEMASGGGEYLAGLGTLMGCDRGVRPVFFDVAQERYETILPSEKTTSTEMLQNLKREMRGSKALAQSCTRI